MNISVTREDIAKGEPLRACSCPIALAIKRVVPTAKQIAVSYGSVCIDGVLHKLPNEAVEFAIAFDNDEPVTPFDFYVS